MQEIKDRLDLLKDETQKSIEHLDLPAKKKRQKELEIEMSQPEFWNDAHHAKSVSKEAGLLRQIIEDWEKLAFDINDIAEICEMIDASDVKSVKEMEADLEALEKRHNRLNTELYLSGEYDQNEAIISFHAGTGGVDAQDFAEMLMRMYLRYCEKRGWKTQQLDMSPAEEAGIKSAAFKVIGAYAFGYLKGEAGVHRLVRHSPFNSKGSRETSFALVEVVPDIGEDTDIEIREEEIEWDFYRAGGKGGQNVNKVSSAARAHHIPTGIVVACQMERSQIQNREVCLQMLKSKLVALKIKHQLETIQEIKGEHLQHSWGNQIRSYVLHPYKMVKDHRTNYETSQVDAVLDGDLDEFIEAELRAKK